MTANNSKVALSSMHRKRGSDSYAVESSMAAGSGKSLYITLNNQVNFLDRSVI